MTSTVGGARELRPERRRIRNEDAALVYDEPVDDRPIGPRKALVDLLAFGDNLRERHRLHAKLVEQLEVQTGEGAAY